MDHSPSAQNLTDTIIERVAFLGAFDPLDFLPTPLDRSTAVEVLQRLGTTIEEVIVAGQSLWRLTDDARVAVLRRITDRDLLDAHLSRAEPAEHDLFGKALQRALLGKSDQTAADDMTYAAIGFASHVPLVAGSHAADPVPVRRRIARAQEITRVETMLPGALQGRDRETETIRAFTHGEALKPQPFLETARIGAKKRQALLLTGVGGVGKSALIADILREDRRTLDGSLIVVLDFDRPNLYRGDRVEILREITRQIGRRRPALDAAMQDVRNGFGSEANAADVTVNQRRQIAALEAMRQQIAPDGNGVEVLQQSHILIILDTFEEISARGPEAVEDIFSWFEAIRREGGLPSLRLLVSGRSAPDIRATVLFDRFDAHVHLAGLDEHAGADLLRATPLGADLFDRERARQASRALGGHPQALKLLLRYADSHPDEIDEIIAEGLESKSFQAEFAQNFLYRRILGRIQDRDVAALAHPGLALRRVTAPLIREVLAGPCGFGTIDRARASELLDKLSRTAWIVETTSDSAVVHHKRELRRLMIPAMLASKDGDAKMAGLRDKVIEIHRLAAEWYAGGRDPDMAKRQQDIEAFYHRACADPETLSVAECKHFAPFVGEDLSDLPVRARAIAKVVVGRGESLSPEERSRLPDEMRKRSDVGMEDTAFRRGDVAEVGRSHPAGSSHERPLKPLGDNPVSLDEAERRFGREINALWAEADFEGVVDVADHAFSPLWDSAKRDAPGSGLEGDVVLSAAWKSLMARVVTDRWPTALLNETNLLSPDLWARSQWSGSGISAFGFQVAACALAHRARWLVWQPGTLDKILHPLMMQMSPQQALGGFNLRLQQLIINVGRVDDPISRFAQAAAGGQTGCSALRIYKRDFLDAFLPEREASRDVGSKGFVLRLPDRSNLFSRSDGRAKLKSMLVSETDRCLLELPFKPSKKQVSLLISVLEARLVELHDPILAALRPLARHHASELAAVGEGAFAWPDALSPDAVGLTGRENESRFLSSLIDAADRRGLLRTLLQRALAIMPHSVVLQSTNALVNRVETLFHGRAR